MNILYKFYNYCMKTKFPITGYFAIGVFLCTWFYAGYVLAVEPDKPIGNLRHAVDLFKVMATIMLALVGTIQGLIAFIYVTGMKNIEKIMSLHMTTFTDEMKEVRTKLNRLEESALSKEEHKIICSKDY